MSKLPKLPKLEADKLARIVQERQLYSVMNSTKWSELLDEVLALPPLERPRLRMRSVFAPRGFVTEWGRNWYYDLHPVEELEWIEMLPKSGDWLVNMLGKHHIPYSSEDGLIRVWGYVQPGSQPDWQHGPN